MSFYTYVRFGRDRNGSPLDRMFKDRPIKPEQELFPVADTHRITMTLDQQDYETVRRELEFRRDRVEPDGDSCTVGTKIAEMIRDLDEYRDKSMGEGWRKAQAEKIASQS